jgi:AcrR family transcriptional regulator
LREVELQPPPRQERSRRTRAALLKAALGLFAQHGYERTSIGEIAAEAGVGAGTLYQHFRSKRQLLLVLMDSLLEELEALNLELGETGDPKAVLERALHEGLLADRTYAGAYRAWREAVLSDLELRELDLQVEAWTAWRVELALRSALQLPGARRDVDVAGTAQLLNLLFWRIAEAPHLDGERAVQVVTRLMMHSLFEDGAFSP